MKKIRLASWNLSILRVGDWSGIDSQRLYREFRVHCGVKHGHALAIRGCSGPGNVFIDGPLASSSDGLLGVLIEYVRLNSIVTLFRLGKTFKAEEMARVVKEILTGCPQARDRLYVLGRQPILEAAGCKHLHGDLTRAGCALAKLYEEHLKLKYV